MKPPSHASSVADDDAEGDSLLGAHRPRDAPAPVRKAVSDVDPSGTETGRTPHIPGLMLLIAIVMAVVGLAESARGVVIPTLSMYLATVRLSVCLFDGACVPCDLMAVVVVVVVLVCAV